MTCGADLQRIFMFILGFNKNPGNNTHKVKKSENPQTAHTLAGAGLAQSQSH